MSIRAQSFTRLCWVVLLLSGGSALLNAGDAVVPVAGNGTASSTGDNGPATAATLNTPLLMAKDGSGNIYITEYSAHRIRKIDTAGVITTFAGTGVQGFSGNNGPATAAQLNRPVGIVVDSSGNVIFSEQGNHILRKVTPAGIIQPFAGTGTAGFFGDSGLASNAQFDSPATLALDLSGNILVGDLNNNRIRKITASMGIISTIAGNGVGGYGGDNGPATSAQINAPGGIVVASNGDIYFSDGGNERIRKISGGNITTFAGTGVAGFSGDNGLASAATFQFKNGSAVNAGLALDESGNILVSDYYNYRLRKIDIGTLNITTVMGNGSATYNGDGQTPLNTAVNVLGLLPNTGGAYTFVDADLNRIRKIVLNPPVPTSVSISATVLGFEKRSVKSGTTVTFTATGFDPNNIPLMYTWDFGDGTPFVMGNPVTHAFNVSTGESTFTVDVNASHGGGSLFNSIQFTVGAPAAGGTPNIGQTGPTVFNPLLDLKSTVFSSDGGVIELDVTGSVIGRSPFSVNSDFDGFVGRRATRMGFRPVERFDTQGVYVATHTATDLATGTTIGKLRRTIAISNRELGQSSLTAPSSTEWAVKTTTGKFNFASADSRAVAKPKLDAVTYTGTIELPAGLTFGSSLPVSLGIGNVIDALQVTPKGKAVLPSALKVVKKLSIKFPRLAKGATATVAGQKATITVSLSAVNLSGSGFDTEGITNRVLTSEATAKSVSRSIQVALTLGDMAYQSLVTVQYKLQPKKMESGSFVGRAVTAK